MQYILTLWLLWTNGDDYRILQVSPFFSEEACISHAKHFIKQVKADGVVVSRWSCKLQEEQDA